jgi:WD40 repeat protein
VKVFGKDFMNWAVGKEDDDSIWMDAEEVIQTPSKYRELRETLKTPSKVNIQSLTMGGLDHSFLVNEYGIDVLVNRTNGLEGKDITIKFQDGGRGGGASLGSNVFRTPKKGMLMRGESNMMLISPSKDGKSNAGGVSQLDIGTGKMVAEWKFEKDGTPITMRDVTNDSKGAQLYGSGSTFLGLDDNRLCRWDMRDSQGIVQQFASPAALTWTEGHQFSKGTNFSCFATSGDGSVVVGSKDGKVRLYGITSMRMAKTAFPGLGSPITHVDVTYDGKWVLATTDTYLILISTVFKDKDGKLKTGFSGRMGGKMGAPRLLKLRPFDAHRDGKQQKLHGGKFSWVTEEGKQERHLVVSAGNFTVVWDFDIVKDSHHDCYRNETGLKSCYCYEVVAKPDNVVQSAFMHEKFLDDSGEVPLVVATRQELSSFNI